MRLHFAEFYWTGAGQRIFNVSLNGSPVLSNYDITYNTASFSITPKAASVTPDAASKTYGDTDPLMTGALNGFLVTGLKLPSIAVTIGTLTLYRGIAENNLGAEIEAVGVSSDFFAGVLVAGWTEGMTFAPLGGGAVPAWLKMIASRSLTGNW